MKELRSSNEILGDAVEIRRAIDEHGYVFFRDVIDKSVLEHVKHGVMAFFAGEHLIEVTDDEPIVTGDVSVIPDWPKGLEDTKLWEWLALRPEMRAFYEEVFGEPGFVLPIGSYQFTWPGRPDCWDRVHQDGPHNAGVDFLTFWLPLMSVPESLGGLAIVPRPAAQGSLHGALEDGEVSPWIPADTFDTEEWHRADYEPGDVLIFGPYTPHCGMPNNSDRLRLTIDIRVQPVSERRPILGVVTAADTSHVVIAADSGDELTMAIDEHTYMRPPKYSPRPDPSLFIGQRVIASEQGGTALLVRRPYGHVPWEQ